MEVTFILREHDSRFAKIGISNEVYLIPTIGINVVQDSTENHKRYVWLCFYFEYGKKKHAINYKGKWK